MKSREDSLDIFNFDDFYQRYYKRALLFAKSYVHDLWAAEDIASGSLISLWEVMRKNDIQNPPAFLFSIIKNKSIDYLRHELIHQEALTNMSEVGLRELHTRITTLEACDPEKIYTEDIKRILERTLQSLPEKTRKVFVMSRYQNRSKNEIAEVVGVTVKGVDYHLSKAMKCLRVNLKDYLLIIISFLFLNN